ncbi:unnamed protein product [Blepharisma stoltei]|uniref:ATPase expression protein 2, mitochondrial n=1 Tax=Blepharisma stoltei TaxID=1481888 RepID=A0AAU9JHD6_9CILI|nr:unnamed protein product [Blepharisma stoltei]
MFLVKNVFWRSIASKQFLSFTKKNLFGTSETEKIKQKIATNSPDLLLYEVQHLIIHSPDNEKAEIFKSQKHFILKNLSKVSMQSISGFIIEYGKSGINDNNLISSLRWQFVKLSEKGYYCKYSLSAATNFLIQNSNDSLICDYITKIIKAKTYDQMDLIQAFVYLSRFKDHPIIELFLSEIPKCYEAVVKSSKVPEVLWQMAKQNYRNDEFYIKIAENIEKIQLKNPGIDVTKIFTAYALTYFEHKAITKALDFLMENYHSVLATRSLSNLFHELINCPLSIISPKSWDILKTEIESRENLGENLWDLSSIFHCYKKLGFDMQPLFKHITEENLEKANGQQLAVIITSLNQFCTRDWLPWLKRLTLKKINDMHAKSAMMMAMFWTQNFYWDQKFWEEFEPILDKKLETMDTNLLEKKSLGMYKTIGARLIKLKK